MDYDDGMDLTVVDRLHAKCLQNVYVYLSVVPGRTCNGKIKRLWMTHIFWLELLILLNAKRLQRGIA